MVLATEFFVLKLFYRNGFSEVYVAESCSFAFYIYMLGWRGKRREGSVFVAICIFSVMHSFDLSLALGISTFGENYGTLERAYYFTHMYILYWKTRRQQLKLSTAQ